MLPGLKEFERLQNKLKALVDEDSAKALKEARSLPLNIPGAPISLSGLKACILIDAGYNVKDKMAASEGVSLLKELLQSNPKKPDLHYNLANGLDALASLEPYKDWSWYLVTSDLRRDARTHFHDAFTLQDPLHIGTVAFTNLGNALWKAYRWVEAYDAYTEALRRDPTNVVAATGAARILLRCIDRNLGEREILLSVAARHIKAARNSSGRIKELAGARAYKELSRILDLRIEGGDSPDLSHASKYERFVASHRLALTPTIEGLDPSMRRWDSLRISSIIEPLDTPHGVPSIFAMFNSIKSDFMVARLLAYEALSKRIPDSGFYSDTLDYAIYGVKPSMLTLSQRACMDVLDKIATATSDYLKIPGSVRNVYFSNRWFTKQDGTVKWHPSIGENINKGITALLALSELSLDINEGGFLSDKKNFRHSSTHRFTVLHDEGCNPSRPSECINHANLQKFESLVIESLQLTRAAILYFHEMIQTSENQKESLPGKRGQLIVPSHHSIRRGTSRSI